MPMLQFKGKPFVQTYHLTLPYQQLIPDAKASMTEQVGLDDNLIIKGDNLRALKALLPTFRREVKCIYIDPPYNTGNEKWLYNDNVNSPMHQEWLKKVVDREDLTRHDKWLCMMLPRLRLLKELLRLDGVIFISIDDNEVHHLRMLMDDVFGEENFIAQLVWNKGRKNDAKLFSVGHEYMVVYARDKETLRALKTIWREPRSGAQEIWSEYVRLREEHGEDNKAIENDLQKWFKNLKKSHPSKALSRYAHVDKYGPWRDRDISWPGGGGPRYEVKNPRTGLPVDIPERGWGFSKPEEMERQVALGLVEFRDDEPQKPPIRKAHLRPVPEELTEDEDAQFDEEEEEEEVEVGMQVMSSYIYAQSQTAVKLLRKLMGAKVFDNPKDHTVLARIFRYVTSRDKRDIILDSFAGSGTTGHAVLSINAEDGGNRRFILIEQEDYAETLTAERIGRVISGMPGVKDETLQVGLGGSYSFFRLGEALDEASLLRGERLPSFIEMARYAFFNATLQQLNEAQVDEARYYLGTASDYEVYMIYQPDIQFLRNTPLTLSWAQALDRPGEKTRLVIASHKYLDDDRLRELNIEFCQLPFEILRFRS